MNLHGINLFLRKSCRSEGISNNPNQSRLAWIVTVNENIATKSPRLEEEINKKVS